MESGEILSGGNSNQVIRQGGTVVRQTGAWSPFVHQLLTYLHANGFAQAPALLESGDGWERLSFIKGEVGNYPLQPYMQSETVLIEAAQLLRRFHDLTQHFPLSSAFTFQLPLTGAHDVICHNDFAPYNCVFQDEHLAGVIDFDTAAPGTRLWDIAYAVYRFAPLTNDQHCVNCGWNPIPDRSARLKLFCDAYGLEKREELLPMVRARINALIDYMRKNAFNLDHIPTYEADLDYIAAHEAAWSVTLNG